MNKEAKLQLAKRVMQIAGIFTAFVSLVLLINYAQLKKHKPLESETLTLLVEQLKEDPRNDKLREEIRDFDLMVRKAYFTSSWQVNTGAVLLLIGGIVFALSLKVYTDIRHSIGLPGEEKEDYFSARDKAWKWIAGAGALLFGLSLLASFTSVNYLNTYYSGALAEDTAPPDGESVEIIEIIDTTLQAQNPPGDSLQPAGDAAPLPAEAQPGNAVVKSKETPYGLADFKKQHNTFRGPMGLGVTYHKNIPVSWDGASGNNVLWKVAVSKPGYNSPVIWGDKIFIAGADEESRIVSCYNRHTGQLLWERKADNIPGSPAKPPKVTEDTGLSASTAAVDGYRVYAIFATGDVIAFDLDGNRIWARNLGVPRNHYGHSSSLFVWNGKLIIQYDTGTGGRMLALNVNDGNTVWDIARANNIAWSSPILAELNGKVQVVTSTDPNVAGYDVETGEERWKIAAMMGEVGASCAFSDGLVFANNEYASLVAIKPGTAPSIVWEKYDYLSEAASPVAYNGLLFLGTSYGVFVCYDALTGEMIYEKELGAPLYSSPMVADGKVYQMDNKGVMHILRADRSGTVIGNPALGEPSYAIPAFAEGRIYLRGSESLYCIGK